MALKLHRQFDLLSVEKLVNLLKSSGSKDAKIEEAVNDVSNSCVSCFKCKRPPPRAVVSLPMASRFNDTAAMDLKTYGIVYFLVLVDLVERFRASSVITNKMPAPIIKATFIGWITIFGTLKNFLNDNGGEFSNDEMRDLGEKFDLMIMSTAAQSPWSNGAQFYVIRKCEQKNGRFEV